MIKIVEKKKYEVGREVKGCKTRSIRVYCACAHQENHNLFYRPELIIITAGIIPHDIIPCLHFYILFVLG